MSNVTRALRIDFAKMEGKNPPRTTLTERWLGRISMWLVIAMSAVLFAAALTGTPILG
jgi:hypothetical protein